ncbi:MAG: hypothetical protein EHM12_12305 [Dehalococcoidia bacterium]|nr:MAG: hypothetical protein EHM12_12305 [Dehalococcoidia bacterium]
MNLAFRIGFPMIALLVLSSCSGGNGGEKEQPVAESELKKMADEDQAMRLDGNTDFQKEYEKDLEHRERVFSLLAEGKISTPEDMYYAALLLQHTPLTMCDGRMTSLSRENYLLANMLAKASAGAGYGPARRMVAMTIDRYLWYSGRPQKYGTNSRMDEKTGENTLEPLDSTTTDEERAKWDVEPLKVLKGG